MRSAHPSGTVRYLVAIMLSALAVYGHSGFDPFFTTKPNGLGMGLSISRTIIAAHGGELCAIPAMGRGAIFRFCLPTSSLDPKEGACDR